MTRREEFKKRILGSIQIDRVLDVQKWVDNLKTVGDEQIKLAIMTANNFMPGSGQERRIFFGICYDYQRPNEKRKERMTNNKNT
jgi:hypothetical protein